MLFADDAKCFKNANSYSRQQLLQQDIAKLTAQLHGASNITCILTMQAKCVHMILKSNTVFHCVHHYTLGIEVQRDLGLMIPGDLTWSCHYKSISLAYKIMGLLHHS